MCGDKNGNVFRSLALPKHKQTARKGTLLTRDVIYLDYA